MFNKDISDTDLSNKPIVPENEDKLIDIPEDNKDIPENDMFVINSIFNKKNIDNNIKLKYEIKYITILGILFFLFSLPIVTNTFDTILQGFKIKNKFYITLVLKSVLFMCFYWLIITL
jgi:hypothetical protein